MAEEQKKMVPTLGLTGVTVNAMALIAPGAFLWITFVHQAGYAFPSGMAMWAGIFVALMLAYATALSYSELAKLYPGAGSSYLFAEQAFLSKTQRVQVCAHRQVRNRMVVASLLLDVSRRHGRHHGRHDRIHRGNARAGLDERGHSRPGFHGVDRDHLRVRRWHGSRSRASMARPMVNIAINGIQIVALLFFSALAIAYRAGHPAGSMGLAARRQPSGNWAHTSRRRSPVARQRALGHPAAQV